MPFANCQSILAKCPLPSTMRIAKVQCPLPRTMRIELWLLLFTAWQPCQLLIAKVQYMTIAKVLFKLFAKVQRELPSTMRIAKVQLPIVKVQLPIGKVRRVSCHYSYSDSTVRWWYSHCSLPKVKLPISKVQLPLSKVRRVSCWYSYSDSPANCSVCKPSHLCFPNSIVGN